jgi:hypothetical protein
MVCSGYNTVYILKVNEAEGQSWMKVAWKGPDDGV